MKADSIAEPSGLPSLDTKSMTSDLPLVFCETPQIPYLNFRSEAITVCGLWRSARDDAVKRNTNKFGLVTASHLLAAARSLEHQIDKALAGHREHPDQHAAQLACVDWIAQKVSSAPKLRSAKAVSYLDRFFWGYLENTPEFDAFFKARKAGRCLIGSSVVPLPKTRPCYVGCAYGAPTIASLGAGTGNFRGRGRWPMIFIDDKAYAVLGKNKSASQLLYLSTLPEFKSRDKKGMLIDKVANVLISMSVLDNPDDWPKIVVQRGGEPRQILHLAISRRGSGAKKLVDDEFRWLTVRGRLFEALIERQLWDFEPSAPGGDWGSFKQLVWHLTVAAKGACTHSALFSNLPVQFCDPKNE